VGKKLKCARTVAEYEGKISCSSSERGGKRFIGLLLSRWCSQARGRPAERERIRENKCQGAEEGAVKKRRRKWRRRRRRRSKRPSGAIGNSKER